MTTTDWIIDIALVLIVVRQMREGVLSRRFFVIPTVLVTYTAHKYLHGIPTTGNDLWLVVAAIGFGSALGIAGGLLTKVRSANEQVLVKAGWAAALLWITSMTARLGFIIWITHSGVSDLTSFSVAHSLSASVWESALVLLALSEVVFRMGIIGLRGYVLSSRPQPPAGLPVQSYATSGRELEPVA